MRLVVILALLALLAAGGVRVQALRTVAVKARRSSPRAFCGRGCVLRPNTPSHLRALPGFALEPAIVRSSVVALGELLSVVGLGIVAAKKNVLSAPNVTALSQIVYNVLLPCLLITSVAKTIVTQPARALLPIPLFAMAQIFTGLLVAGPVMRMVGLKRDTEAGREARVCAAFANSGVLPLVFCAALFQGHPDPTMLSRSMAYVSFFLMGWSPIFWTRGFSELVGKEKSGGGGLKRALGPPIVACAIGILVGVLKPIRYLLMGPDAPLSFFWRALTGLAAAYPSCGVLVLAGSLANGPKENLWSKETAQKLLGISLVRWAIMPLATASMIWASIRVGLMTWDPLIIFMLMLQTSMPSAQNSVIQLQIANEPEAAGRLARTLFLVYTIGIIPVSALLTIYMQVLGVRPATAF